MGSNADGVKEADPSPAKVGLWEDFVDIFYTPSSVFARRSDGKFGLALLFLAIVILVLIFLTKGAMAPVMDAEFARQTAAAMRKDPRITEEQMAAGRRFFEMAGPVIFTVIITISALGTGLIVWLVGKLFDAKESLAAAMMIATYSEVPRVVQILTNAAQGLVMSPEKLTGINAVGFSLARFMDPDGSPGLLALAGRVDLFTIWVTVLLAIGLHVVGKIPKQQAAFAAAITWVVGGLFPVFQAFRQG
jgi:hypothetical protein